MMSYSFSGVLLATGFACNNQRIVGYRTRILEAKFYNLLIISQIQSDSPVDKVGVSANIRPPLYLKQNCPVLLKDLTPWNLLTSYSRCSLAVLVLGTSCTQDEPGIWWHVTAALR